MRIRRSEDRGQRDFGWLQARHSFSFGDYFDPEAMGFRSLRVLNEDTIAPGGGFPMHPHRNMEILTYVVAGELEHRDDLGNRTMVPAGSVQVMSAGRGIRHSEMNPGSAGPVHLFQVWIEPAQRGGEPWHRTWQPDMDQNAVLLASPTGEQDSARIDQQAWVWRYRTESDGQCLPTTSQDFSWIQVVSGRLHSAAGPLQSGDALLAEPGEPFAWQVAEPGELLWFQLS